MKLNQIDRKSGWRFRLTANKSYMLIVLYVISTTLVNDATAQVISPSQVLIYIYMFKFDLILYMIFSCAYDQYSFKMSWLLITSVGLRL